MKDKYLEIENSGIRKIIKDKLKEYNLAGISFNHINIRALNLIAESFGSVKLEEVLNDKNLLAYFQTHYITPPLYVYNFIKNLISLYTPKSILDPCIDISSPVFYSNYSNVSGLCLNSAEFDIIKKIFNNKDMILHNNTFEVLQKNKNIYDLIISFPKLGYSIDRNISNLQSRDLSEALIFESSKSLSQNGKLIFLVSSNLCSQSRFKELLHKNNLFVDTVFSLPPNSQLYTSIDLSLLVITTKNQNKTFIAELSANEENNNIILKNYQNKQNGNFIKLGYLTDFDGFKSIANIYVQKEMENLAKQFGYPEYILSDISISIKPLKENTKEKIEQLSNSIYIPKIGYNKVALNLSEMKGRPSNYFQVQLKEEIVNSNFLANYFNSQIGRKLIESISLGNISHIYLSDLKEAKVYLPDLKNQNQILELDNKIRQFAINLDELNFNLWNKPLNINNIADKLKTLNEEKKLEDWIDNLPFPIASILWRYYATIDINKKIEYLFFFFEALAEFISVLMLSISNENTEFFEDFCKIWNKNNKKKWYRTSSFGNWNRLNLILCEKIKKHINSTDANKPILFPNIDKFFIKMICDTALHENLSKAVTCRNKWKGHTGISNPTEKEQRHLNLENLLNNIRKIISNAFLNTSIILPLSSTFSDGVYTFKVKQLNGAKTPFIEKEIQTIKPLEKNKLYLYTYGTAEPIELVSFIKFDNKLNAFYFYSSVDNGKTRWVSYHFEAESELYTDNTDILNKFEELNL